MKMKGNNYNDQDFWVNFIGKSNFKPDLTDVEEDIDEVDTSFEERKIMSPESYQNTHLSEFHPLIPKPYNNPWQKEIEDIIRNC